MTPDDFRRLALSLPEASESAHMNHPDFRVGGKIFATLGYPNVQRGTIKLTPELQREFIQLSAVSFEPVSGGWGRQGSTSVRLESADETLVHEALSAAWRLVSQKTTAKRAKKRLRS